MDNQKRYDSTTDCHKKINCSVCNCQYHSGEDTCTAKQVAVGPQYACCSQDTVCATFKPEK